LLTAQSAELKPRNIFKSGTSRRF